MTPPVTPLERHARDELWEGAFDTFYVAYFQELLSDCLVRDWQIIDEVTKVAVALTASGSAIAGWSLWSDPNGKTFWAVAAGIAAVLSIVHAALGVPARLRDHIASKRQFAGLRTDLETFRYRMRIDSRFSVADFTESFAGFRKRLGEETQRLQNDFMRTRRLEARTQDRLDVVVKDLLRTN
jgi:hypothetical protein